MATKIGKFNIIIDGKRLANCNKVDEDFKWDNNEDPTFDGPRGDQAEYPTITIKCSNLIDRNTQYENIIKEAVEKARSKDGLNITLEDIDHGITTHYLTCLVSSWGRSRDPKKASQDFTFTARDWEEN